MLFRGEGLYETSVRRITLYLCIRIILQRFEHYFSFNLFRRCDVVNDECCYESTSSQRWLRWDHAYQLDTHLANIVRSISRQWVTPFRTHRGQDCQEERKPVHPSGWSSPLLWLYSSTPHLHKWRPMHADNVRTTWGHMWQSHQWVNSRFESYKSRVLLIDDEWWLCEIC